MKKIIKFLGVIFVSVLLLSFAFNFGRGYERDKITSENIMIKRQTKYNKMSFKQIHVEMAIKIDSLAIQLEQLKSRCFNNE
jgi:hypothetical protein